MKDEWGNKIKAVSNPIDNWLKKLERKNASGRVTLKMKEVAERKRRERLAWQAGYDKAIADMLEKEKGSHDDKTKRN